MFHVFYVGRARVTISTKDLPLSYGEHTLVEHVEHLEQLFESTT